MSRKSQTPTSAADLPSTSSGANAGSPAAQTGLRPNGGGLDAYGIIAESQGKPVRFVVLAHSLTDAALEGVVRLREREGGPWRIIALRHIAEALVPPPARGS
jgi:hypothetical protein